MTVHFWRALAKFLARPRVVDWLITRAKRTPYRHITGPDGSVYMERYWLFNPYDPESDGARPWWQLPIGIRLHHILREDDDRGALHDHPWHARTFILRGWYREVKPKRICTWCQTEDCNGHYFVTREVGETATLKFGEYHRIIEVSKGGVWTLFVTGRKRGTWGFLVDGQKVQWRKFLGIEK